MRQTVFHFTIIKLLFLFCLTLLIRMNVYAQEPSKRISLTLHNVSLQEFTKQVEKVSGCTFVYGEDVKLKDKLSVSVKNTELAEMLKKVFVREAISFRINGRYVFLQRGPTKVTEKEHVVRSNNSKRHFTISGYIMDKVSSETLIGANVYSVNDKAGTATNAYGYYSITLPEGEILLHFSYLGYTSEKKNIELQRDTVVNIRMLSNNQLQEVTVYAEHETGSLATGMGAIDVSVDKIKDTPSLMGESDVLRTIQLLPGVQSGVSGSAGLYVRGGDADENLILLDGVPVYKVDHLFGFFSAFTPEAVKKVTFFKGSFPARFGERLSSVIDVRTRDGDMYHYHGTMSLGILTDRLNFEGPIVKGKTSFNLTARRSWLDWVAKPFMKGDKFGYDFYDINAKINHKFSDSDRLYLSIYHGGDQLNEKYDDSGENDIYKDGSDMNWGNTIGSLRWNHVFSNQLFCNMTVAYNKYKVSLKNYAHQISNKIKEDASSTYKSSIKDWSFIADFDYNPSPSHHVKFGGEYMHHTFSPEVTVSKYSYRENGTVLQDTVSSSPRHDIAGHEATFYVEDNWKIDDRLQANIGFHTSMFNVQKRFYSSFQPRLSLRYQVCRDVALKVSYTKMAQYVHLLASSMIAMPTDLWVPVTKNIKPMNSNQISWGGYYTGMKDWEFSIETYYKEMNNVLEYKDGVSYFGSSSNWENLVGMGKGRSYGVELMLEKKVGKMTGWLSYTLSKSDRIFNDRSINNGERFPYAYDRRHTFNFFYDWKISSRFDLNFSWMFYTGGSATIPMRKSVIIYPENPNTHSMKPYPSLEDAYYVSNRNNYRLPVSHTLSLGLNFRKKTKHGMRIWNVSVYNAYDQMNPMLVYREDDDSSNGNYKLKKFTLLPMIPSVTYTYSF